jgi:AcrR family transcriptional regulator
MDKRTEKTKRSIANAFLQVRSKKDIERITVKELADLAEISKATFYLHYKDIYDLSDQLSDKMIEDILLHISQPENIIRNPALFISELTDGFLSQKNLIDILFSGSQNYILPHKINNSIRSYIYQISPEYRDDARFSIRLSYSIKGCYYAFMDHHKDFDMSLILDEIKKLAKGTFSETEC